MMVVVWGLAWEGVLSGSNDVFGTGSSRRVWELISWSINVVLSGKMMMEWGELRSWKWAEVMALIQIELRWLMTTIGSLQIATRIVIRIIVAAATVGNVWVHSRGRRSQIEVDRHSIGRREEGEGEIFGKRGDVFKVRVKLGLRRVLSRKRSILLI